MMKSSTYTIQFRMTKKCNAQCSYCIAPHSSNSRMSEDDFKRSIDYLVNTYLPSIGSKSGDYVDLEYVGGEISLLPSQMFISCIDYARAVFERSGYNFKDGAQSNFVGNTEKLKELWDKFEGRMTTSVDHFTDQRRFKGTSENYRKRFEVNVVDVCKSIPTGSVYVLDLNGLQNAVKEAKKALSEGYAIGLYPAYEANNPVDIAPLDKMAKALIEIMDEWVLNYDTPIEPLGHILRMVLDEDTKLCGTGDSCPFAYGCSSKSICVEPNGDLYVCMDMAETKRHKLGNAVEGVADFKLVRKLSKRGIKSNSKCIDCKYRNYCKGGCMNHAMINGDEYSESYFCEVWFALFEHCEKLIIAHGKDKLKKWFMSQDKAKFYC
ncbi:SPASM domain-containing protein [Vibrio antiquarius]|uniref:SPASM domain-containing protein n=5 Tax=Vibrionaceae TaxID=641 RepID=A0AA46Z8Q7_VIBPH|nr:MULTISPECIES: SPASM domain-containing protein [Vibrio]MCS0311623.1 SPASM domain-containing protein [Vibrio diabolicus]ARN70101.1 SPASM domain-containing protein [Vibrio vulnificus]EGQ8302051.1 SPASM domain-containing protein [Vibrio parahaemolyticus]EGQ8891825.1 SPASM domain-containing protein [Vibrio parahaemolyticus]EGR2221592.1 SPASM domain-containing protein [Vibrio parahaemolyticus]